MKHLINWVEIPVTELERAKKFYETVFGGIAFHEMEQNGNKYAIFPSTDQFNTGALVQGEFYKPSPEGINVYLDGGKDMDNMLKQVGKAGGEIIMPKTFT